mgnify:FL=1
MGSYTTLFTVLHSIKLLISLTPYAQRCLQTENSSVPKISEDDLGPHRRREEARDGMGCGRVGVAVM